MVALLSEKGHAVNYHGWWRAPDAEETPELFWPQNIEIYDRMRRQDAQVISVLRAVTLPIRRTAWRIDPAGARPEVVQMVAEDLGLSIKGQESAPGLRSRDRFSWPEHLRLALLMLTFGHSFFEQVYRADAGQYRLRKLGWRPPRTISKIDVAADGGLVAIEQHAAVNQKGAARDPRLPVGTLVAYINDREGGNWLGQSLLRPAFKFWFLKDRLLRTQSMTVERNGLGVPVYVAAPQADLIGDERIAREKADMESGLKIAQAYRSGDNSGAAIPNGATLELKGVTGDLPDADGPIRYYDEQIARAVLAHFLNLGTETGSWALGSTFADFFTLSLQTVAMQIADVTNQHVIEDLVDLNFGETEPAPRLVFDEIGSRHPATPEAIKQLIDCGAIEPDAPLEEFIRLTYGMPAKDASTVRQPRP